MEERNTSLLKRFFFFHLQEPLPCCLKDGGGYKQNRDINRVPHATHKVVYNFSCTVCEVLYSLIANHTIGEKGKLLFQFSMSG